MIFIIGISPKTRVLDQNPRRCPVCGLHQAYHKRIDHYLSLFFIPIFRVKKGDPFIVCDRCEKTIHGSGQEFGQRPEAAADACRYCGKPMNKDFTFCPYCGKRI